MADNFASVINQSLKSLKPIATAIKPRTDFTGQLRAVLFDIYGTLLISGTGDIGLASEERAEVDIENLLIESGLVPISGLNGDIVTGKIKENVAKRHGELRGLGIDYPEVEIRDIWKTVLKNLRRDGLLEKKPSLQSVAMTALKYELAVNPVWPMPGFPEIVDRIKKGGFRIGIVSNAQFYTPIILEVLADKSLTELGFEPDLCAWSYDLSRSKPSPEVFKGPLNRLLADGITPSEVLYVGNDMLNDVAAASRAGCKTALFAGDRRSLRLREHDDRAGVEPDMVITELSQLEKLISQGASHGNKN